MSSRDEHTPDRLEPTTPREDLRNEGLSDPLEPGSPRRRPRTVAASTAAVVAVAALIAGAVGATIWANQRNDVPARPLSTGTQVVTSTTATERATTTAPSSPATSASPVATATTSARPARTQSTASLLVAADYAAAGWTVSSIQVSEGWGQSPISECQDIPGPPSPGPRVFRGDGSATRSGPQRVTFQYVLEAGTVAEAEQLVDDIVGWPEGCDSRSPAAVTSSRVRSVELAGGRTGHWYTLSAVESAFRHDELVAVTRVGDAVSVVVLHEYYGSTVIDAVNVTELLSRASHRLG